MQRSILIGLVVLAISFAAIFSGFGGTGAKTQQAATKGGAPDRNGTEVLAIQTGSRASLRHRRGNSLELTIDRPSPRTLYFTDSPERRAQSAPVGHLPAWVKQRDAKQGHPPNVALSWHGQGDPGSLAATLRDISYESGRLRATLDLLRAGSGAPASLRNGRLGVESFSNRTVSMVFDGSSENRCFAEIETDNFWRLESSSAERNDWLRGPPQSIGSLGAIIGSTSDNILYGCEL